MKNITIPIDPAYAPMFFKPIRSKSDVIVLLMTTIKYVITPAEVSAGSEAKLHIIVDDMNRFVYESKSKIFSIRSPFNVNQDKEGLSFVSANGGVIDSSISSKIIKIVNSDEYTYKTSLDLISIVEDEFYNPDQMWALLMELMSFEDGYLRFDDDDKNKNGRLHPKSHLDIYYTTASTFKIGTHFDPCVRYFIEMLNNKVDSKYLEAR